MTCTLADLYGASMSGSNEYLQPNTQPTIAMAAPWSYVHGLASLLIDGRLNLLAKSAEGVRDAEDLLVSTIEHVRLVLTGLTETTERR